MPRTFTSTSRTRPGALRLLLAGALALAASGAFAQQADTIELRSLEIRGNEAFSESRIRSVMSTAASGFWPWSKTRYFDRQAFDADLDRITSFYADHGYPDARIASVDTALSDDQRSIAVTITIDEGEPVRVASIRLNGFASALPEPVEAFKASLPIEEGDVLAVPEVNEAENAAVRALKNDGYPHATVAVDQEDVAEKRVRLTFTADPGPHAVFGDVAIDGNASVGDEVVRRSLVVEPGEPYSLTAIQKSVRRLYDLELFQFATLEPRLDNADPSVVPVHVTVAGAEHRRLEWSAGWGTEEHLRGGVTWTHLNFFGGARKAQVEGKWSSLDRGLRASLTEPYILGPNLSATVSGQGWFADEPAYQLDTRGGRISATRRLSEPDPVSGRGASMAVSASVSYDAENFAISTLALQDLGFRDELIALGLDPRTGVGRYDLTAVGIDLRRTTTSDPLDSRQGYLIEGHLERGGGWLPGDFDYVETTAEGRYFLSLTPWLVFANRVRIGSLHAPEPLAANVPFFKRYFLGGSNSLRGWGRFEVAPLSGSGLPLGGHSMLELSSEVRVLDIYRSLGIVLFVDGGNAWVESWHAPENLRWDAGPGLRYATPIGPIRADLAFQLTPIDQLLVDGEPETRHWRVQFSIGQAF